MKIGLLPLGRPTFDVAYAEEKLAGLLARLDATGHAFVGARELLFDAGTSQTAIAEIAAANVDRVLILQVTFTDAAMTVEAARALDAPLSLWAVPEPRAGGRLRLNAFCGLNLASHALGLNGRGFSWAYGDGDAITNADLDALLTGGRESARRDGVSIDTANDDGRRIAEAVRGARIARVGEHPVGFDTCAYRADRLQALAGVTIDEVALEDLFARAQDVPDAAPAAIRTRLEATLDDLDAVDQEQLDKSLRLKIALDGMREDGNYDAFAIRCWPETFTEYGGAVCGPVAMMGEARVPCACEADVYGALTQLILQQAAQAPVFLVDLVDMDLEDDTGVVWHCGQAPMSMRDETIAASATIHTNRKMPLLFEFPLKPGRVTLMRVSQAFNDPRIVIAGAEMLSRPMAFTGTSGVLRFDRPAGDV
ncbi:MAG: hypothetical protein AAFV26_07290, partial [Pseudomonadota bacterium]